MDNYIVAIDGGTTNTRLHLMKDGDIVETKHVQLGANSDNKLLEDAIRREVDGWGHIEIDCFIASGMLTSNIGLMPTPHTEAPFDPGMLSLSPVFFENIHKAPFYFISGVKFFANGHKDSDLIKGEETEIFGFLRDEDMTRSILCIHFGTHNKAMLIENGVITDSVTTMGGELLHLIVSNSILKSSVADLADFEMVREYVETGFEYAAELGLTRCLFLGRTGDILFKMSKDQVLSFVYGALVQEDLKAYEKLLLKKTDRIVVYGREGFSRAFEICLNKLYGADIAVTRIGFEQSELLSAQGLYYIYQNCRKKGD
ncbi:MAG: 2-dehydro-3-deoxygalactonokinase [Defluviitaleaceae bacterium]|nr:2-dehydro-3-deoxygalactonokinase [Defluviitaleaceae bacterium]